MGREIQKKKRRSQRQPVRQPNRPKKALNPLGNSTVAANWDKSQTLAQNYRRLGLSARLRGPTGGTEKALGSKPSHSDKDPLAVKNIEPVVALAEAKVERDADGKIIRVLSRPNPLNDPLTALSDDEEEAMAEDKEYEEWGGIRETGNETEVVKELIEQAKNPAEKKPRYQSSREREWLTSLVEKHGDDYDAMFRDRKLNPMQQTAADIAKRIKKMKA